MIRSCITASLLPALKGGPFVLWDDLPTACKKAAALGYDAIEIFAEPSEIEASMIRSVLADRNLKLAAHGFNMAPQGRDIHIGTPLHFCYCRLLYT